MDAPSETPPPSDHNSAGNAIPPRKRVKQSASKMPGGVTPKQQAFYLALTVAGVTVAMLLVFVGAMHYAQKDWYKKNSRARAAAPPPPPPAIIEEEPIEPSWSYVPPPNASRRFLARLTLNPWGGDAWLPLAYGLRIESTRPNGMLKAVYMSMATQVESAAKRNRIGVFLLRQNRINEARAQFETALLIDPDYIPALYNLALCAISKNQPTQAVAYLSGYLAHRPKDAAAMRLLTTLLSQLGDYRLALRQLELFLKTEPPTQPLFLNAAALAAQLKQNGKALRYLDTALAGNPVQSVARTYQSAAFRDIRLSGAGDAFAAKLANQARATLGVRPPAETANGHSMALSAKIN